MLAYLGIYEKAINDAVELAEYLLELFNFSESEINNKFHNCVKSYLKVYGDWENITNSIILSYFEAAKDAVTGRYPKFISKIDYYVNGADSHLYYDGADITNYEKGEIKL